MFCDNCVVDDTTSFVEKDGEGGRIGRKRGEGGRGEPFKKRERCLATEAIQLSKNKTDKHVCIGDETVEMPTCSEPYALHRTSLHSPEHDYGCRLNIHISAISPFFLTLLMRC